jgi:hypothetical protein
MHARERSPSLSLSLSASCEPFAVSRRASQRCARNLSVSDATMARIAQDLKKATNIRRARERSPMRSRAASAHRSVDYTDSVDSDALRSAVHLYPRALKSCTRHPVRARTRIQRRLTGTGLPAEVAVGVPAASAAEMKELIYLPESYNSLSTCIRTPPPRAQPPRTSSRRLSPSSPSSSSTWLLLRCFPSASRPCFHPSSASLIGLI